MPSRDFTDSSDRVWRVWNTTPTNPRGMPADHAEGWLTFESGEELRRLVPIPSGWESCPPDRLALMCRAAEAVQRRTGPFPRLARPVASAEQSEPPKPTGA